MPSVIFHVLVSSVFLGHTADPIDQSGKRMLFMPFHEEHLVVVRLLGLE